MADGPDRLSGMQLVRGGAFLMGSADWYPEEGPPRRVHVKDFWIDETPVTNRAFARFVEETGHVTTAEIAPSAADFPELLPGMDKPGSLLFVKPATPVPLDDPAAWWRFVFGVDWRHPWGAERDIDQLGLWDHPVVHVSWDDAAAYAAWAGKDLPTEAEHEFAAMAGAQGQPFPWGTELNPGGQHFANTWQGVFPFANTLADGWERTSPVGAFPANAFGLHDMIGNVWEWTRDTWSLPNRKGRASEWRQCCRAGSEHSRDANETPIRKVIKGGSHLCAPNYCQRYRPAARHPETIDTSTSHIGFRCVHRGRT